MAVDIEELIITPFREVVQRGSEAVTNGEAGAQEDEEASVAMVKAAKGVVREGERALKRLQPLWDSQVEKYGDVFKTGMSKNEEIGQKRRKLEDLLYDFEDFIELHTFVEERYFELQAATKSLALDVLDIIRRLKIDGVPISPPPRQPAFPPLPPLPPHITLAPRPPSRSSATTTPTSAVRPPLKGRDFGPPSPQLPEIPLRSKRRSIDTSAKGMTDSRKVTPQWLNRSDTKTSHASSVPSVDSLPPYSSHESEVVPLPLDIARPTIDIPQNPDVAHRPLSSLAAEPVPQPSRENPCALKPGPSANRRPSTPEGPGEDTSRARFPGEPVSPASTEPSVLDIPTFPLPRISAWVNDQAKTAASPRLTGRPLLLRETVIPENEAVDNPNLNTNGTMRLEDPNPMPKLHRLPMEASPTLNPPFDPSPQTASSSPSPRASDFSQANSVTSSSVPSAGLLPQMPLKPTAPEYGEHASPSVAVVRSEVGMGPLSLPSAAGGPDDGLMVAEDWKTVISDGANSSRTAFSQSRQADCSIGPKSSLYQLKGFCEGAQAYKGGGHWQGIKKSNGYVAGVSTAVGRCISCGYAHHYDELSMDVDKDPKANFTNSGIRFRVRFLYKSHLITHKMAEAYYACLFCAQVGSVVREGDATVFLTSDALFQHLARHPQPLPEVPGLTVLYGVDFPVDDTRLNDFDVHFLNPPVPGSGIPEDVAAELGRLPIATATKSHVQRYGEKKLARPDGLPEKDVLQFFVGARLVGVEFPVRWGGKWATAWHNGTRGTFPAKVIEFERPRRGEQPPLAPDGTTGRSITTRWKFEPKDANDKGWLAFDKGETLHNVGWTSRDSWCWSGVNSKGTLGVFPRAFVHFDAVREEPAGPPRPGSAKSRKPRPGGGRTKFFGRGRAPSTSGSSSISGGSGVIEIISR